MKSKLTKEIEKELFSYTNADGLGIYGCYEVCLGAGYGNEYVDFMTMSSKNVFRCYEIKVSVSDFLSKNKLSFVGDFNYLVIPNKLLKEIENREEFKLLIINGIGILLYEDFEFELYKKPKNKNLRLSQKVDLMHFMIRSLSRYCESKLKEK